MPLKRAVESFEAIIRIIRLCSAVCGADVVDPDYRVNPLTVFVLVAINLYLVCTGYTIYVDIYIERDWTKVLQTLCLLGSAVQGYCKLLNAILGKENLRFLVHELHQIYEEYDKKDADYRCYLGKSIDGVSKSIKLILAIYVASVIGIISVVPIYRLFFHENIFVMQFLLPGIDPETEFGYIVMNCMHCTCIILGAFGNFAADTYFFTYVSHIPLLTNILKCKIRDLNEELEEPDMRNTNKYSILFKDILRWHQKYM
uniref:Odorant receptor n=2 Tax=Stomoxys calcitrans TaxID=35570 RepID=A0A1I8Q921_STOCA